MNNLVQGAADRELGRAIAADEEANAHYYQILRRFISSKSDFPGEKLHQPEARLDAGGLRKLIWPGSNFKILRRKSEVL